MVLCSARDLEPQADCQKDGVNIYAHSNYRDVDYCISSLILFISQLSCIGIPHS